MRPGLPLALCLAACSGGPTTLLLDLDGPSSLTSLDLKIAVEGGATLTRNFTLGAALKLPGSVLVELSDRAAGVTLDASGHGTGLPATAHAFAVSQPHDQARVTLTLGAVSELGLGATPPTPRPISNTW